MYHSGIYAVKSRKERPQVQRANYLPPIPPVAGKAYASGARPYPPCSTGCGPAALAYGSPWQRDRTPPGRHPRASARPGCIISWFP